MSVTVSLGFMVNFVNIKILVILKIVIKINFALKMKIAKKYVKRLSVKK